MFNRRKVERRKEGRWEGGRERGREKGRKGPWMQARVVKGNGYMNKRLLLTVTLVVPLLWMPSSSPLPTTITFRKKAVFLSETLAVNLTFSPPFFTHKLGIWYKYLPCDSGKSKPHPFLRANHDNLNQYDGFSLPVWSRLACEPQSWPVRCSGCGEVVWDMCPCSRSRHHKWWLLSDLGLCYVWPGSLKMFSLLEAMRRVLMRNKPALSLLEWRDRNLGPDDTVELLSGTTLKLSLSLNFVI